MKRYQRKQSCGGRFFKLTAIAAAITLVLVALMLFGDKGAQDEWRREQESKANSRHYDSIVAAQAAIKSQLLSPAGAKFPGAFLQSDEYGVWFLPNDRTVVKGYVDAPNPFNVLIRHKWRVEFNGPPSSPQNVGTTLDP